jgi:hypothetical protein
MASRCRSSQSHELCITVSFDGFHGFLTIEFPHRNWAENFCKRYSKIEYHEKNRPYIDEERPYFVRMAIPKDVHRVQVRGPRAGIVLAFNRASSASDWVKNSELWESTDSDKKTALKTNWTHQEFDQKLGCSTSRQSDEEDDDEEDEANKMAQRSTPRKR